MHLWLREGGRFTWMRGCVKVLCGAEGVLKVVLGGYKQHVLQLAFATCELSEFYKAQAELKKHRI